jgi:HAD superfamily hydrolase (TIGR01509 family)
MTFLNTAPNMPTALLFDMDGLLVETESIWHLAEREILADLDATWTRELGARLVGGPISYAADELAAAAGGVITGAEMAARLVTRMESLLATEPIHWRPGAKSLIQLARDAELPCALVSNSYRGLVNAVLDALATDLGSVPFSTTVSADEVRHGKPAADPYLAAAARLEARPEHCLVLEDSLVGVTAGLAAGCRVLAVPSEAAIQPGPRLAVRSTLEGLTLPDLAALFND